MSQEDEVALPDESFHRLQKSKPKAKTQHPLVKYTPRPPMKKKQPHELATADKGTPGSTHRGRRILCHAQSVLLPERAARPPSPSKPKSALVQMSAFQWPAIQELKTDHENASIDSEESVHISVGRMIGEQMPLPGVSNTSLATLTYKRQEDEVKRRTSLSENSKDVRGLPPRNGLKTGQWRRASASQRRDPKMPNIQENRGRDMGKAVNNRMNYPPLPTPPGKKLVCIRNSAPLPRRSPSKIMSLPKKPNSAPLQMASAFQFRPVIQAESDQVQTTASPSQGKSSIIRYGYHPSPQKRRVRFLKTESEGPDSHGEARFHQTDGCLAENEFEEVFDLPPTAGSQQTPNVVSRFPQKAMNTPRAAIPAHVKEHCGNNDDTFVYGEGKLNVAKYVHDMVRNSSPDTFVAQLIANSKLLTLYDSVESPTLQERKKRARALRKMRS